MDSHFSKVQSQYLFYEKYTDAESKEQAVAVRLSIDYKSQTFSITPERASNDKFAFIAGDKNTSVMWYAVAEAIIKANKFAREELDFNINN
jgi:hypothetical protein